MIQIHCEHLVTTQGPHGTWHHIAFNPTKETIQAVKAWHSSEELRPGLEVTDRAGCHVREYEVYCTKVVLDYDTLVFTTNR